MASLKTMMDRLPPERRERVEKRAAEIVAEELTLRDLRKARALDAGSDGRVAQHRTG